ncbi:MAG: hypothetical protein ACYTG0_42650 [Planctomycetota bacterium]
MVSGGGSDKTLKVWDAETGQDRGLQTGRPANHQRKL